ncbi:GNAT family acetyltransferase [[Clostridium] sordellii]|uniref:GNAT family N-acetyltransferase n=1 Tax=Paraclostridium sordellii TaxID=1505 RepID=UPI0005E69481|nr:GNAT family N-acetyltransferase [Paeniclostridium sordellii]MDU7966063.1 GNAT family N-acetyltransferase [Paeniclostridium sordellii]CEQ22955.1 GNAT family acetyltransferase [[Clostridium] sordellii] [Paeniclostridium sordellii]
MKVIIRPVKIEDSQSINEIRRMNGVKENTLAISSERVELTKRTTENLDSNNHTMVAEIIEGNNKKVVGLASLNVNASPRIRHSASIGISVHVDYQGMGIGKKLMKELIDLSDNWLMLVRLELGVYPDNEKALKLYKSLGFEEEGLKKYSAIRNGKYVDEIIMGRYNKNVIN